MPLMLILTLILIIMTRMMTIVIIDIQKHPRYTDVLKKEIIDIIANTADNKFIIIINIF